MLTTYSTIATSQHIQKHLHFAPGALLLQFSHVYCDDADSKIHMG